MFGDLSVSFLGYTKRYYWNICLDITIFFCVVYTYINDYIYIYPYAKHGAGYMHTYMTGCKIIR